MEQLSQSTRATKTSRRAQRPKRTGWRRALVGTLKWGSLTALVLVVLGDHQPHTYVTGRGVGHDVPVSVIAHDPAVLQQTMEEVAAQAKEHVQNLETVEFRVGEKTYTF